MTPSELNMLLAGVAVSSGVLALLLVIYPRLRAADGRMLGAGVEAALKPIIWHAVLAAYRLSEKAVDQSIARPPGAKKKELADSVYRLLPEKVGDYDLALVKAVVTQERFQALVQNTFDEFDRFYLIYHRHFDEEFKKWMAASAPPSEGRVTQQPSGAGG
ncbi:MAG: hypothetical protein HY259_13015 [Chloroflexi bacterium]|nr:hypothetical protein [Chloroflexota bacterium]MBI3734357.1 hypothetical protein [Chloroflexota bacterium]